MMIDMRQIKGGVALQQLVNQLNTSYDAAKVLIDGSENVKAAIKRIEGSVQGVTGKVEAKADKTYVDEALKSKATKEEVTSGLAGKADKSHKHAVADVTGLGTVATKNFGTADGEIPILGANGKLATSVLPSVSVNEKFVVATKEEAMEATVEIGDIVIIQPAPEDHDTVAGTFMVVDSAEDSFEAKFRPLQSASDFVSRAEIEASLELKADKTELTEGIETAKAFATSEANRAAGAVEGKLNEYKRTNDEAVKGAKGEIEGLKTSKADKTAVTEEVNAAKQAAIKDAEQKVNAAKQELNGSIEQIKNKNQQMVTNFRKEEEFEYVVAGDAETEITLPGEPLAGAPIKVFVNGVKYKVGPEKDLTIKGKVLTWINSDFELGEGFVVEVMYYTNPIK